MVVGIGNRQKLRAAEIALQLVAAGEKPTTPIVEVPALEEQRLRAFVFQKA